MKFHQSEVRNFVLMTSYEVACYRLRHNRVREIEKARTRIPESLEQDSYDVGRSWLQMAAMLDALAWFATMLENHVRDVITRNLSFCVI